MLLVSCGGGGDSSVSTVICKSANCSLLSPAVGSFVQTPNNMQVKVEDGPRGFTFGANTNILYATVTLCKPNADPASTTDCQSIDKVIVDTGSVGLRVLASKVRHLGLTPVPLPAAASAWECFPFVVGGLWGQTVGADVLMGQMRTEVPIAVQLIEDKPDTDSTKMQVPLPCKQWTDNGLYESAESLGGNGILGIGSVNLDCGGGCLDAAGYSGYAIQYYSCPVAPGVTTGCSAAAVDIGLQVSNPVSALPAAFKDGFVLAMPAVTDPGAASATGELIFGLDTNAGLDPHANNMVPSTPGVKKVLLGMNPANLDSYLNVTTHLNTRMYVDSYLDTGTNYFRFTDDTIATCALDTISYCPPVSKQLSATISDGDNPGANAVVVPFQVSNTDDLIVTSNTAFATLAAAIDMQVPVDPNNPLGLQKTVKNYTTFAWGMPFFYGKKVYMSIWDITNAVQTIKPVLPGDPAINLPPWYAWTANPL